jgi:glycosyltransferase involved in cell wall biosynthesis
MWELAFELDRLDSEFTFEILTQDLSLVPSATWSRTSVRQPCPPSLFARAFSRRPSFLPEGKATVWHTFSARADDVHFPAVVWSVPSALPFQDAAPPDVSRIVVATSEARKRLLASHHAAPSWEGCLRCIPPGLSAAFHPQDWTVGARAAFRWNIGSRKGFLMASGNRLDRKGLDFLLKTYKGYRARNKEPRALILYGDLSIAGQTVAECLHRDSLANDVILLGDVSDEFLRRVYSSASLFLDVSTEGAFPIASLAAMACGCPVIASASGETREVLGAAATLLEPDDAEIWADAIVEHHANQDVRVARVEKGFEQSGCYTWTKAAAGYLDLYREFPDQVKSAV